MSRTALQVGPADHGKRMSLEEFEHAEGREGFNYELGRGVIIVVDVPDLKHGFQHCAAREQISAHWQRHPSQIVWFAEGGQCKILLSDLKSERHPDLAVYKTRSEESENLWAIWIPEIVIEFVSESSRHRDYVEKREEYFAFGVREYWIIDEAQDQMLVLRRTGGRWVEHIVRPGTKYRTRLLPKFEFDLTAVFMAARADD